MHVAPGPHRFRFRRAASALPAPAARSSNSLLPMLRAPLLALLLAGPLLAQPAAPSLQNLVSNSPFGVATAGPNGLPVTAQPIEFRGTFVDGGERFFSLLDPASRRAEWVGLNEPGRPFLVKSYDAERESISVEHQGRTLELKLHSARIVTAAMPAPAAPAAPGAAPANAQARPATTQNTSDAQRLAQVAEEIRRRRALRQQATTAVTNEAPRPPPASR